MFVLAWIIGIHLVEANFLNPKIMGDAAKIHPVLVVFALIAGEHSYGLVGALFAVPVASIIQTIFVYYRTPPDAAAPPGVDAAVGRSRRDRGVEPRRSAATRRSGCRSGPTISAERSGTSCQPGPRRRRRGSPRRPARAAPRAGCGARCAPSLRSLAAWQTGQSEIPSTCEVAHRVRAAGRHEAAAVGRDQRDLRAARAPIATSSRSTNARLLRSAACTAVGRAASAGRECRRRAGTRGTGGRGARSATGRGCCGAGRPACSRARARGRPRSAVARRRRSSRTARSGSGTDRRPRRASLPSSASRGRRARPAPRRACP